MYTFDILEQINSVIELVDTKTLYYVKNNVALSNWIPKGDGSLGFLVSHNNNIGKNVSDVYFSNVKVTNGSKIFQIDKNNFEKVIINFSVRKTISSNWLNQNDEYLVSDRITDEFYHDSIIYSLFNNSSYHNSTNDIKNQFFWMSKNEIIELANQNNYNELYNDVRTDSDRYVHTLLFGEGGIYNQLSYEAKVVLDKATELTTMSMTMRRDFANETNHLNSWDAGYSQLKLLWKEHYPEQFKEFRELYKNLENRMRPMVYELGFLIK
jgi:hypothetical protein